MRLSAQIGSGLVGMLYVLDEPTAGLHPADVDQLGKTLLSLRDQGNTLLVVEHDAQIAASADHLINIGPGAGEDGGRVVADGKPRELEVACDTVAYMLGKKKIAIPKPRRSVDKAPMQLRSCHTHNLKNIDVDIPSGAFVCVTGVSGSGKSSLVLDTLAASVRNVLAGEKISIPAKLKTPLPIQRLIEVDGSPIGKNAKSNPATYVGAMAPIRTMFAALPEARARGYTASRFSFNAKGGRCERCAGEGTLQLQMQFMPDATVVCEQCDGSRFNAETLKVQYRGASVADVLNMRVDEVLAFFEAVPQIHRPLMALQEVGLGYLQLGRPATTLSGGESQRVKIAKELGKKRSPRTLYVLDEPTRGLHFVDVERLLPVLHRLVDEGHTVVVVEHDLDVIASADHVIEIGPASGAAGGEVVFAGTPEGLAESSGAATARFLRRALAAERLDVS